MTLALYGKSRRRKGALLTAALLAVIIATVGALGAITSAFAHHSEYSASRQCDNSWSASASYVGGSGRRLVLIQNVKINGVDYAASWSNNDPPAAQRPPDDSGDGGTPKGTNQVIARSAYTGTGTSTNGLPADPENNDFLWVGVDDGFTIFSRSGSAGTFVSGSSNWTGSIKLYSWDGSKWVEADSDSITQPPAPTGCGTIIIKKVVAGPGSSANDTFTAEVNNKGGSEGDKSGISFSQSSPYTHTFGGHDSKDDFIVKETATAAGYSLAGYKVLNGDASCPSATSNTWTTSDLSNGAPIDNLGSGTKTVCFLNIKDSDKLVLSSSACVIKDNVQYAQFHFIIPQGVSESLTRTLSGTHSGSYNSGNFGPYNEDSDADPNPDWTFDIPFGSNTSIQVLTASTNDGYTWPATGAGRDKDTVSKTSCQPVVVEPGVSKVAANPAYSSGYAHWIIKVNNTANASSIQVQINDTGVVNDGSISGGTCSDTDISDGQMTCTVNAGQTLEVPVKKAVTQQCKEGKAENTATIKWRLSENAQWSSDLTAAGPSITIPADESKCGLPEIKKEASQTSQTSDPSQVAWVVTVSNPNSNNGITRNVIIKELSNVTVVSGSSTGGAGCSASFTTDVVSSSGAACTMPAGSTLTFTVKPNPVPQRECRDKDITNTVELYLAGDPPTKLHTASSTITLPGNPEFCTREIQVCKVLVDNQDGITKTNQSFTIEVNDGSQTQQVTLTVNEGGEQACRTVTVPANAEVKVSETADRPAGWNGDAHGYWNLTLQQGTTYLVTNKENPITVTVKFQKVICESLGDVAANQSTSTNDDIGKPSMSATGGLSSQLNQTAAPAGGDDIVTPSNDGRSKNCHVWGAGAGETGGWNFYIKSTDGSSTLSTVTHQAGNQYATHQLTPAELALAVQASSLRVEEELRTGYGFAGLKCWKDHLNGDNWEWLDFSNGLPGANDEVWCIAYNVPATKQITVQKTFYGASQVSQADYPTFTISDGVDFATACTGPTLSGSGPVTATWTCTVPYLWNGTVTETPAKGWEACERIAALVANNGSQTQEPFTFTNCKQPTIIVKKVVTNVDNDTTQFTVTLTGGQSSQTGQIAEAGGPGPVNATFDNLSTGLGNTYTVVEQPQNGYQVLGYTVNPEGGVCPADPAYTGGGEAAKDAVTVGNLQPGETRVICFYNERFGSVVVDKQAPSGDVAPGTTFNWTISVSVTDGPTSSNLTLTDTLPSGFTYGSPSAASPLSCTLTGLSLSCTLPANTPIGTYTVTIPATVPTNTFAICGRHTNTVSFSGAGIEGRDDATVTIGCTASDGRILVKKVVRGQPGDTTQFTAELTGPGITGTATQPFSQQNVGFFLGLAAGTFSVSEQPKAGYDYAGWAIGTIVGESVQCPANPTGAGSASVTLTNLAPQAAVCFYNDARVTIRVHKTLNVIGFTSNGQGWQFTLTGCGITPQTKTTDANGIADFTDLPPAISCVYTVTETVQPGWTPQFVSQTAQPVAGGQVVRLEFLNIKDFNPPCTDPNDPRCVPPPPPSTPTPTPTGTPTTPTGTPTTPTVTTTPPPTATPTNTPTPTPTNTPVTQVAGERTPGPGASPTPLAPSTGYGFGSAQGGMSLLLVLAGLISLSLGLGFIALGRRTNR